MSETPSPNGPNGRTNGGKFAKGNAGGPGNPYARRTAALRSLLLDAIDDGDWRQIVEAMKRQAMTGDMAAIKLLLAYTIGAPPATAPNPDRLDWMEREQRRADAMSDELNRQF